MACPFGIVTSREGCHDPRVDSRSLPSPSGLQEDREDGGQVAGSRRHWVGEEFPHQLGLWQHQGGQWEQSFVLRWEPEGAW